MTLDFCHGRKEGHIGVDAGGGGGGPVLGGGRCVASIVASAEASMVASGEAHHCHPGLRLLLHRNVWFIHKQLLSCYQLPRILSIGCIASEADSHMNE